MGNLRLEDFREEVETATAASSFRGMGNGGNLDIASCSLGGVAAFWGAAIIEKTFEDFPRRIELFSADGRDAGLAIMRSHDGWSLDVVGGLSDRVGLPQVPYVVPGALRAMGIPDSSVARNMLADRMKWRPGLLVEASEVIPVPVLEATFGYLADIGPMILGADDEDDAFDDLVAAARARGCDLNRSPVDGMAPALIRLAWDRQADYIWSGFARGLFDPDVEFDGWTPARVAIQQGSLYTLKALHRNGMKLDAVDERGNTLLHFAAMTGTKDGLEIADFLGFIEFDRNVRNADGNTACDLANMVSEDFGNRFDAVVPRHAVPTL